MVALSALVTMGRSALTADVPAPLGTLDPNRAPWWELALLPRVGPTTARAIVAYRRGRQRIATSGVSVYRQASDLLRVRGIGPRTLMRIYPHLRFPQ